MGRIALVAFAIALLSAPACNAVLGVGDLVVVPPDAGQDTSGAGGGGGGGGGGACDESCAAEACCGGACVDLQSDGLHCGACDNACSGTMCVDGGCTDECAPPFADCNESFVDGCEANLDGDPAHCGSCTTACAPGSSCDEGACVCPRGLGDCDGDPAQVCETSLDDDEAHCGDCMTACAQNETCTAGACGCTPGFFDCDGRAGCEASANDPATCGNCQTQCSAAQVCNAGVCDDACSAGLELCDMSCVDLQTDPSHCGACNNAAGPNQMCSGGAFACNPGWGDCTADPGCETNVTSDSQHCGACPTVCKPGALCAQSACQCSLATPNDCGAQCAECCDNGDCAPGNVCVSGMCTSGCPGTLVTFGNNTNDTFMGGAIDTYIEAQAANHNYGNSYELWGDGMDDPKVALLEFGLSQLPPNAYLCSATLRLSTGTVGSNATFTLHRVLEDWTEGTGDTGGQNGIANWSTRVSGTPWSSAGCGAPASCEAASVGSFVPQGGLGTQHDVALSVSLVQGWVNGTIANHGVAMKTTAAQGAIVLSSESSFTTSRPSLRIDYFVP